ncbi:MAG: zinc-ribbon domain-containing protein [Lentisphaeria bacterium]|nr:TM2 domain-containing protein [Victivallales bacterium]MCR4575480.1 zinc-ribbon domain-containing protein [Lentisphaeria bacterium]
MFCTNCGQEIPNNAAVCSHCGVAIGMEKKFCANCGQAVNANQAICLKCGCALPQMQTPNNMPQMQTPNNMNNAQNAGQKMIQPSGKSATTATILSCLITGLGQIYLGQTIKGVVMLLGGIVISLITAGIAGLPIWIITMVDAYKIGKKLEAGQSVGEWEFF